MLSLGNLSVQVQFETLWQNLQLSSKPQFLFSTHLNLDPSHGKIRSGFCLNAVKNQRKGDFSSSEMDGPDDFDDEFSDVEDDGDEYEGDEDDEVVVPLKNMKRWVENRPRGFGEGKSYDTSIEDKLMEEIEQSKIAQLANVNNLKHNPLKPGSDKETSRKEKGSGNIQVGFGVRLVNLPKKKNIHRDLRLAFQGVPGLLNIVPVVAVNEKTRDPVCKGLAFVYFKYQDEARRFVQNFSGQNISFGKNQKKITCEMMERKSPRDQSVVTNQKSTRNLDKHLDTGVNKVNIASESHNTSTLKEHYVVEETSLLAQSEDDGTEAESMEISSNSESNAAKELETEKDFTSNSSPLKKERKPKAHKKKVAAFKGKKYKSPKLNIPGSANRLKVRDKAMLTDVFSKYGSSATATLTVKQHSK